MKSISAKLRSTRGETLAEILVSIAILGFSITLMLTMVATSTKITKNTRDKDVELMNELNTAEQQLNNSGTANVTISCDGVSSSVTVEVNLYSETGSNLISYSID